MFFQSKPKFIRDNGTFDNTKFRELLNKARAAAATTRK